MLRYDDVRAKAEEIARQTGDASLGQLLSDCEEQIRTANCLGCAKHNAKKQINQWIEQHEIVVDDGQILLY